MVDAMRKRGVEVEYIVKDNEGHGFANEENRFEFYGAMERFLSKNSSDATRSCRRPFTASSILIRTLSGFVARDIERDTDPKLPFVAEWFKSRTSRRKLAPAETLRT